MLVDWDTTLTAAPERDLWMMTMADASVIDSYEATTGWEVLKDVLDCYRLWWDLSEICGYVTLLRDTHDGTDDIRESWKNLQHSRPRHALATTGVATIPRARHCRVGAIRGDADRYAVGLGLARHSVANVRSVVVDAGDVGTASQTVARSMPAPVATDASRGGDEGLADTERDDPGNAHDVGEHRPRAARDGAAAALGSNFGVMRPVGDGWRCDDPDRRLQRVGFRGVPADELRSRRARYRERTSTR